MIPDGHPAAGQKYRYTWTMPLLVSQHNPDVIYHSSQFVFRSADQGRSWTTVSPTSLAMTSQAAGFRRPHHERSVHRRVLRRRVQFGRSPKQDGVLWAGTDDGLVHVTRDGGKNWANVTPKEMPEWPWSA